MVEITDEDISQARAVFVQLKSDIVAYLSKIIKEVVCKYYEISEAEFLVLQKEALEKMNKA